MLKIGIIAGSGFSEGGLMKLKKTVRVRTPYGKPSDLYRICELSGVEVAFLSRHGSSHHISPQLINYRANIWGFKELGIERILSVNAVGGISRKLKPGDIVVPDQIIDMTHGRDSTFYEGNEVIHVDFTMPYCTELRKAILRGGKGTGRLQSSGSYICVNGPRLETKAEISYFSKIGADIVGMTGMPEASLSRELQICFAAIAVVTNYAAGISRTKLTATEVVENMKESMKQIGNLLVKTITLIPQKRTCECKDALEGSMV